MNFTSRIPVLGLKAVYSVSIENVASPATGATSLEPEQNEEA
jgi:hypothetical protein